MRSSTTALVLLCAATANAWVGVPTAGGRRALPCRQRQLLMNEDPPTAESAAAPEESPPSPPAAPAKYDVSKLAAGSKQEGGGSGFNQFDPVMTATGFISRRFGLVGGLAVVGLLAVRHIVRHIVRHMVRHMVNRLGRHGTARNARCSHSDSTLLRTQRERPVPRRRSRAARS